MRWSCKVPWELPSCNDQLNAERIVWHVHGHAQTKGMDVKKKTEEQLVQFFNLQNPPTFTGAVNVFFEWHAKNRRKDKDNIAFAKKYILDALQKASIIKNDSWNLCTPLDVGWVVDPQNVGVLIEIESVNNE